MISDWTTNIIFNFSKRILHESKQQIGNCSRLAQNDKLTVKDSTNCFISIGFRSIYIHNLALFPFSAFISSLLVE